MQKVCASHATSCTRQKAARLARTARFAICHMLTRPITVATGLQKRSGQSASSFYAASMTCVVAAWTKPRCCGHKWPHRACTCRSFCQEAIQAMQRTIINQQSNVNRMQVKHHRRTKAAHLMSEDSRIRVKHRRAKWARLVSKDSRRRVKHRRRAESAHLRCQSRPRWSEL